MKILHIINSLDSAGAERLCVDLAVTMRRMGHEADILTLRDGDTALRREAEAGGVSVKSCRVGREYDPRCILRLRPLIAGYDVLHVHLFPAQYWTAAAHRLAGSRALLVTTEHNNFNARARYWLTTQTDRLVYRRYAAAACISEPTLQFMQARTRGRMPLRLIRNGINTARFASLPAVARSEVLPSVPAEAFLLLQVARFREQKDQDAVIRALAELPADVHAAFAGDGEREAACREQAAKLGVAGRCHFLGVRTDVPALLTLCDAAVMSSHWEGFGLAAAEAMAAGKVVLASNVPGLREVVGSEDLLFSASNERELAKKVLLLRGNFAKRRQLEAYCQERAAQFGIERTAENYIKFYQETIKGH